MADRAIKIHDLGKMYRLYRRPADKVLDAFGINRYLFWRKKYYQEFWALRGLNLEVNKGERLGIIGRNGAGKSTLLKIITGNVTPTEGTVKVNGRVQALMELGTGFHPEFTGRQNIQASLAYQGLSPREIAEKEEEIIDFSELDEFIEQPIKTYSAGMYARLAFTVATVVEPEILIIDEVLGAGDAYFAGKCVERMKKLTEESGATVLFVSHDLGSVQALCNRVIWFHRGILKADGEPLSVIKQYGAAVRQEEEIRLRARDLKISKKQTALLEKEKDIYQKFLFRIVGEDGGHPHNNHKVRSITLFCGSESIGTIEVGAPMDNQPEQLHFIMDEPGLMDWGTPAKDTHGFYRPYGNFEGKYAHAPFEFAVPKSYLSSSESLSLEINADCEKEAVFIEFFLEQKNIYHRLGEIDRNQKTTIFILDAEAVQQEEQATDTLKSKTTAGNESPKNVAIADLRKDDIYGTGEIVLTDVQIINAQERKTKTLFCLEAFKVVLEYEAKVSLSNPVFVFCIYLPSGACASQWIATADDIGINIASGQGKVIFESDKLLIGRGSYVASAAIFKHFSNNGLEPEAYHLLDRCIHFQVSDQNNTDKTNYGICRQPIEVKSNVI